MRISSVCLVPFKRVHATVYIPRNQHSLIQPELSGPSAFVKYLPPSVFSGHAAIDDYAKNGGKELFTNSPIRNLSLAYEFCLVLRDT